MNGTFYKFPTLKVMENWYHKSPEDFSFSVKVPKEITHNKKMVDCGELIRDFYSVCKNGLKHKLGCVLFQLPPSYQYSSEKLLFIISQLDLDFRNVIEFRHESWWNAAVWEELAKNNISFCSVSHPQLPETIFTQFPVIYIRFHGRTKMFYSGYSTQELTIVRDAVSEIKKTKPTFIYFNNTASQDGILNAIEMKNLTQLR